MVAILSILGFSDAAHRGKLTSGSMEQTLMLITTYKVAQTQLEIETTALCIFWNGEWDLDGNYTKKYILEIPCDGSTGGSGLEINQTAGLPQWLCFSHRNYSQ